MVGIERCALRLETPSSLALMHKKTEINIDAQMSCTPTRCGVPMISEEWPRIRGARRRSSVVYSPKSTWINLTQTSSISRVGSYNNTERVHLLTIIESKMGQVHFI